MRCSPWLPSLALLTLLTACAREHEYGHDDPDDDRPPGANPVGRDAGLALPVADSGPNTIDGALPWPFGEPLFGDGGPAFLLDGSWPVPYDAGSSDGSMTGVVMQAPGPLVPVSLSTTCPVSSPTPQPPQGCRPSPWHTPACYRAPTDCKAALEPYHCITQTGDTLTFVGLNEAQRCVAQLPTSVPSASLHQLGGDVLRCTQKSVQKVALSDGSMDVVAIPCSAVFTMNDAILVHGIGTTAVARYDSWEALKAGEGTILAYASPNALFGANSTHMVAMWPGSNQADILTSEGVATRRLFLQGFDGQVQGVDLTDDGKLITTTPSGLWIFDAVTSELLKIIRLEQPDAVGLSCQGPVRAAAPLPLSARPLPAHSEQLILKQESCASGAFTTYAAEGGGAELLIIANGGGALTTIRDERSAAHTLVLSAEPGSLFRVENGPASKLERIIVRGTGGAPVELTGQAVAIEYQVDNQKLGTLYDPWYSANSSPFRENIESYTKRKITELMGCSGSARYVIRDLPPLCP